jgi:hypothetical protein
MIQSSRNGAELRTDAALRALAVDDARVVAPAHVEGNVMRAWDAHLAGRRPGAALPRRIAPLWRLAALAGAISLSTMHVWWPAGPVEAPRRPQSSALGAFAADPLADGAGLMVMRVRMSRSALASIGFPIPDPDAAGTVDVEVIVGEDGVARSIRRAALAETPVYQE